MNSWLSCSGHALGVKYLNDQRGCQDSSGVFVSEDRAISVVCDGAGSAKYSHIASQSTVERVLQFLSSPDIEDELLTIEAFKALLFKTLALLFKDLIEQLNCEQADLYTTLLCVCHFPQKNLTWVAHVGDGAILALRGPHLEILSSPHNLEENRRLTYFTLDSLRDTELLRVQKIIQDEIYDPYQGFACFTDGVEDFVLLKNKWIVDYYHLHKKSPIHPDIYSIIVHLVQIRSIQPSELAELINQRWIQTNKTDDDCAISIILSPTIIDINLDEEKIFYRKALTQAKSSDQIKPLDESALDTLPLDTLPLDTLPLDTLPLDATWDRDVLIVIKFYVIYALILIFGIMFFLLA